MESPAAAVEGGNALYAVRRVEGSWHLNKLEKEKQAICFAESGLRAALCFTVHTLVRVLLHSTAVK